MRDERTLQVNDSVVYEFSTENNTYRLPGRVIQIDEARAEALIVFDAQPACPWWVKAEAVQPVPGAGQRPRPEYGCMSIQAAIFAGAIGIAAILRLFLRPYESVLDAAFYPLAILLMVGLSWFLARKASATERSK